MIWKIIGIIGATLTTFGFVPQIVKIAKNKSVKDVSILTILQFLLGVACWMLYGFYLHDYIIIFANGITLITLILLLTLYLKYLKA